MRTMLAHSDRRKVVNPLRERLGTILGNRASRSPRLRLWPSGDVSLWFADDHEIAEKSWGLPERGSPEVPERRAEIPPDSNLVDGLEVSQGICDDFGNAPKQRGLSGLTSYGARMVRSGVALLEQEFGGGKLTFCTITVPSLATEEAIALWRGWPEFLRQLIQFLGRELRTAKQSASVVCVTEIQEKRGREKGEPYLHLHLVWGNRHVGRGRFAVSVDRLRSWVHSKFEKVVGRALSLPRIETSLVKKSAGAYIAKYCSKGPEAIVQFVETFGAGCVPRTWWNLSKCLRDSVKASIVVSRAGGEFLCGVLPMVRNEGRISGDGVTLIPIWLGRPKESPVLGYCGRVWGQFEADLRELCHAAANRQKGGRIMAINRHYKSGV